jgi:hypothetical protein
VEKRSSYWELVLQEKLPSFAIITGAPEGAEEVIRFFGTVAGIEIKNVLLTQLKELKNDLMTPDLFAVPTLYLAVGATLPSALDIINELRKNISADSFFWIVTQQKTAPGYEPIYPWQVPSREQIQKAFKLLTTDPGELNEDAMLEEPHELLQMFQKVKLGLSLSDVVESPLEGSGWDILLYLMKHEGDRSIPYDKMMQLCYALEMIHQASITSGAIENFRLPYKIKKMIISITARQYIDSQLLPCYQKILQSLLTNDQLSVQFYLRLWVINFLRTPL